MPRKSSSSKKNVSNAPSKDKTEAARVQFSKNGRKAEVTKFRARVFHALCSVPSGKVTTYGRLALSVGLTGNGSRAIGQAMRNNPLAPDVPCHRVIKTDLTLGGFSGQTSLESKELKQKIALLEGEGVKFINGKLSSSTFLFTPPTPPEY
uniref:Methylated-DNA--protein-cysteine methyltransferase n=1 Tax=Palpitomonas bilix TaxID=652834 RepID=A0A7S3G2E4_9EUKA|mmetsp:Transcript_19786/g.50609  ORF Transcript_19786/g.50609 Transcript_19786/m.50609 type:complete len:150 (+) Transcript_19786:3-452(+)